MKRILSRVVNAGPIAKEMRIARVFNAWTMILRAAWGEEKAGYVFPLSFTEGTLKLETRSPAAQQQLALELPRLLNDVNRALGERIVLHIKVISKGF